MGYYTIYRTINKVNGRYYIGSHKTSDLDDDYLGSGVQLKRAIEKYGEENFEREILHIFDNPEDMFAKEAELVTEHEVKNPECYNLKRGGEGGWDFVNSNGKAKGWAAGYNCLSGSEKSRQAFRERMLDPVYREKYCQKLSDSLKGHKVWEGKTHTEETRLKMSQSHKGLHKGSKNSQFGTMWITNGTESKKIKKDQPIPEGYRKGRK